MTTLRHRIRQRRRRQVTGRIVFNVAPLIDGAVHDTPQAPEWHLVRLAALTARDQSEGSPAVAPGSPATAKTHILVIDDDPAVLGLVREILALEGYRVSVASSCTPTIVTELQPDLLIIDHRLADTTSGLEWIIQLRRQPHQEALRAILLTADVLAVRHERDRLTALGVTTVVKPFDLEQFLAEVQSVLQREPMNPNLLTTAPPTLVVSPPSHDGTG